MKATTIAATEMIRSELPYAKVRFSDTANSLRANLEEVKFDKKQMVDVQELNNANAFVTMKTMNQLLFLSPGTVRAAPNATVATSVDTIIPESAIPFATSLISFDNCLCSSQNTSTGLFPFLFLALLNSRGT